MGIDCWGSKIMRKIGRIGKRFRIMGRSSGLGEKKRIYRKLKGRFNWNVRNLARNLRRRKIGGVSPCHRVY
jgi:hypothetical protein